MQKALLAGLLIAACLLAGCIGSDEQAAQTPDDQAPRSAEFGQSSASERNFPPPPLPPDPDLDGVDSSLELALGFDPLDPSSAPVWHPEYGGHPRLLFDADGLQKVLDRAGGTEQPFALIAAQLRQTAWADAPQMPADRFDPDVTLRQSDIAQAAALVAWLDLDQSLADKALRILTDMDSYVERVSFEDLDHMTILGGTALIQLSLAYDLLAAWPNADDTTLAEARLGVLGLADALYYFHVEFFPLLLQLTQNNHNVKFAAGLGLVGLCFNDRPEAAVYLNYAQTEIEHFLFEWQRTQQGGWAEGPNYFNYTEESSLPYLAAYHGFAQGRTFPFQIECATRWGVCEEESRWVGDMALDPRLDELHRWWLSIALPWGQGPPIDDSNLHSGYSGLWTAPEGDPAYLWHFEQAGAIGRLGLAYLALYPDDPLALPPGRPRQTLLAEAGQAVLRSSDDRDALYGLLLGEHGPARERGMGHEHPDSTSFIIAAHGELLLIDSGYINFDQRDLVASANNHNLILVDGQGPPTGLLGVGCDVDAYLESDIDSAELSGSRVSARYRNVDFERHLWMIRDSYFVVLDRPRSSIEHTYDSLWHALAGDGQDGLVSLDSAGFVLDRGDGGLSAHIAATRETAWSLGSDFHGFTHSQPERHEVIHVSSSGLNPAWAAILQPFDGVGPSPVRRLEADGLVGWSIEDNDRIELFAIAESGHDNFCLTPALSGLPEQLCTDNGILAAAFERDGPAPLWGFCPEGNVSYAGRELPPPD